MLKTSDYRQKIDEAVAEDKRIGRIDYNKVAFMLKRPYSSSIVSGPYRLRGRAEHRRLIDLARSKELYVWHTNVESVNGRDVAMGQHLIDWDSVPDKPYGSGGTPTYGDKGDQDNNQYPEDLKCPKCGKVCSSTSGYALHKKTHVDIVSTVETQQVDILTCPHCNKTCSSTSGLTLHINSKHGGKL